MHERARWQWQLEPVKAGMLIESSIKPMRCPEELGPQDLQGSRGRGSVVIVRSASPRANQRRGGKGVTKSLKLQGSAFLLPEVVDTFAEARQADVLNLAEVPDDSFLLT